MCADIVAFSPEKMTSASMDEAIDAIGKGGFIVLADDDSQDNKGGLVCAASAITPEMINFALKEARGTICAVLSHKRASMLELSPMVESDVRAGQAIFTITVDATSEFGVTSGASAGDRAKTIRRLANDKAIAGDFRRPGRISPVTVEKGGVLNQVGYAQAAADLMRLARMPGAGVTCDVMNDDGTISRGNELAEFAKKHALPFITMAQLVRHLLKHEAFVKRGMVQAVETAFGPFTAFAYDDSLNNVEYLVMVRGDLDAIRTHPLVYVHQDIAFADIFDRVGNKASRSPAEGIAGICKEGAGIVIYLRTGYHVPQSLAGLLAAQKRQSEVGAQGMTQDRMENTPNDGLVAQILADLGIQRIRLLSRENAQNGRILSKFGIDVTEISLASGDGHEAMAKKGVQEFQAENENVKAVAEHVQPESRVVTMKMGGKVISGRALYETED